MVKVNGELDCLHLSADVELLNSLTEVSNGGMGDIVRSKDVDRFFCPVKGIDILDREDGQCLIVAGVEHSETHAGLQPEAVDLFLGHIKSNGDGEERAIYES